MVGPLVAAGLGGILMGLGYTTGAYSGYGLWNHPKVDPFGVHSGKGKSNKGLNITLSGMAYGMSGYGNYRYRRYSRFRRYRRYRRFSRYRRRSYYRRRYY